MVMIKVKRLTKDAILPKYAHPGDAGLDLYAAEDKLLKPMERAMIPTGIKIAVPNGYEAQIRPRSGLAVNHGISVVNTPGTIDSGYRGEVMVLAINLSNKEYKIEEGTKIAQMIINKVEQAEFEEVDELDDTTRGEGGMGSTGMK